ncbi:MAG: AAA family ATPase [Candidatus Omnitrophica bacterium]|nr:AAA family ATPase [Candidatus Omnitrophota bacterium]
MRCEEDIALLIQSNYPVVVVDSPDEDYSLRQLAGVAAQLGLIFFQWSVTEGLRRSGQEGVFYQTKEPARMLNMLIYLLRGEASGAPGLYVLKDLARYLTDGLVLRLFKDLISAVKGRRDTVVLLGTDAVIPREIEADTARIVGGYPAEAEIGELIRQTLRESPRGGRLGVKDSDLASAAALLRGLTVQQVRSVVTYCLLDDGMFDGHDFTKIIERKKTLFDQEGLLEFCMAQEDTLAGFSRLKRWVAERQAIFVGKQNAPGLPAPKGVLLMGVQGCGKSLAVRCIAAQLHVPLYRLDLGRLYSKYIGETEQNLRKALSVMEKLAPLCLWIDEIEKAFAASNAEQDGGVSQRLLGTFLTWMQERTVRCFVAATANDISRLPPEFLRKGRFDEIFFVDLPDPLVREELFRIHLAKRGYHAAAFNCAALARAADGFSGAEIEQVIIAALYRTHADKQDLTPAHILNQMNQTKPLSILKAEEILALRQWAAERTIPA